MRLQEWRLLQGLTLTEAAALFECANSTHYRRIETGESWVTAPMGQMIETVTYKIDGNAVTIDDLHAQWLVFHQEDAKEIDRAAGRTARDFNRGKESKNGTKEGEDRAHQERQIQPQGRKGNRVRGGTGA